MIEAQKIRKLLFGIALSLEVSLFAGCLRTHTVKPVGQYQLNSRSDITLLLPPAMSPTNGTTQTTMLDLGSRSIEPSNKDRVLLCSIRGRIFALSRESGGKRWEFQAPNVNGWNTPAVHEEADSEWEVFLRQIAKLASSGCFAKGMGVDAIQQRLIEAMPIPAGEVLRFYYSLGSFGFVDLHPGMQIRVETTQMTASKKPTVSGVLFSIEGRSPVGVTLALASSRKHLRSNEKTIASEMLSKFAAFPLLRLFLEQGTTSSEKARHPILLGARTQGILDQITDRVSQKGERGCDSSGPESSCIIVSDGGTISLLSTITVNGRAVLYAPGTTLAQVLGANTVNKLDGALKTVTVQRRFDDHDATISFSRDRATASKLILINGDRIRWNQTQGKPLEGAN
jgi:hypothetical protein